MRNKRGITLIALVITIIILLILAGVTIGQLTDSGLFQKVQLAKEKYKNAQENENGILNNYEKYINGTRNVNVTSYSTDEIQVGTWINGKPLYQKTIDCGALPNKNQKVIPSEVENMENLVYIGGFAFSSNEVKPLPYPHLGSVNSILLDFRENNIFLATGIDFSSFNAYVTIQYTKK